MARLPKKILYPLTVAVKRDATIYAALISYIIATSLVAYHFELAGRYSVFVYPKTSLLNLLICGLFYCAAYLAWVMIWERPGRLFLYLKQRLYCGLAKPNLWRGLLLFPLFSFFFSAVSSFKTLIPALNPFSWDDRWIELDQIIHGSSAPWQYLQSLFNWPSLIFLLNVVYNLWFFIMFAVLFWYLFISSREQLRKQFLLSFIACWVINGSLLAVSLSSAGPAFYGLLFPELLNPYAELMQLLQQANQSFPLWALSTQDALWNVYTNDELGVGAGISAMPSMHVSIACLIWLLSWEISKLAGYAASLFLLFIMVGSVLLAWHYAIDAYLSLVSTILIWAFFAFTGRQKSARQLPADTGRDIFQPLA